MNPIVVLQNFIDFIDSSSIYYTLRTLTFVVLICLNGFALFLTKIFTQPNMHTALILHNNKSFLIPSESQKIGKKTRGVAPGKRHSFAKSLLKECAKLSVFYFIFRLLKKRGMH